MKIKTSTRYLETDNILHAQFTKEVGTDAPFLSIWLKNEGSPMRLHHEEAVDVWRALNISAANIVGAPHSLY